MDGGAWWAAVHGVATSRTWLSNFPFTFHFHALEKEMATHSSVLAWRIPGMGETGGLPSMGSYRVGHDWSDLAAAAAAEHSLALPFFGIGMKTDFFQSCGHCWVFQICWHIECSTFTASSFRIWNSSARIPSPLLDYHQLPIFIYNHVYMSIPISQFIPPLSFPLLVHRFVFHVCVSTSI